jgi:uroporphyrinogen decarboxylase
MPRVETMNSLERVLTAISHREPDRVPLFLLVTMHGAKELGLSIREYFSKAENVVEGQLRMRAKYLNDCVYSFFYAPVEVEAWGADVIYVEDGPPNTGRPFLRDPDDILRLAPPRIDESPSLLKVLRAEELLKARAGGEVPIVGVVMSPFSLPVLQMGFDRYLDLIYERPALFERLMRVNEEFCVAWANAQLRAGATAITYYDPVSSTTIVSREMYLRTGFQVAKRTIARIQGPTATHYASGLCLPIADLIADTGTKIVGISVDEDMSKIKEASGDRLAVLGNLNGIEMRNWSARHTEQMVKAAIANAGPGGGFILSDNHGEIPFQVPDEVLFAVADAVQKWGRYPLEWVKEAQRGHVEAR